jgi:hypothetical protein
MFHISSVASSIRVGISSHVSTNFSIISLDASITLSFIGGGW